jgi:BASS family bile acid:Na+ symporter
MFRLNDLVLLLVIFSSMLTGILLPRIGAPFQPFPLYLMMTLLFLSFLPIRVTHIWRTVREQGYLVLWLSLLKLIAAPIAVYFLFSVLYPSYAVAALLLTAISTGVVAPFVSGLVKANDPLVLVLVVLSSLLVPFTLPAVVKVLAGRSITLSFWSMTQTLCLVIFIPLLAVEILRRSLPRLLNPILEKRYAVSLVIFAVINLGVFSKYAHFFRQNPTILLEATLVALALGALYFLMGVSVLWLRPVEDRLASVICLGNMNNVLVIVFSARFFGPLEPTLAAMYMIPFFMLLIPMRILQRLSERRDETGETEKPRVAS